MFRIRDRPPRHAFGRDVQTLRIIPTIINACAAANQSRKDKGLSKSDTPARMPVLFGALFALGFALFGFVSTGSAFGGQDEFGNKRKYDATQCVTVEEEQMIVKKRKYLAVFAENKCSRAIHVLACFQVTTPSLKHSRTGWYCDYQDYKARSRNMISEHAKYGRVKKWGACNQGNEDCVRILERTNAAVNSSGQDPEAVAKHMR